MGWTACRPWPRLSAEPASDACDTVLLVDVLYQLGAEPAHRLLRAAAMAARRRVLVRTLDPGLGWRSRLAMAMKQPGRLGWPHSGRPVEPLPIATTAAVLAEGGFAVEIAPCWRGIPFANVLIDAKRFG